MNINWQKHLTFIFIFCLFFISNTINISAGNYIIKGYVKDSISNEGLPFSNIRLIRQSDSAFVKGAITDETGKFVLENIEKGTYWVLASYMGYIKKEKLITLNNKKVTCNFLLIQKSHSLSEISVTAQKKAVHYTLEKTIIDVSQNKTVLGGSAIDVIKTVPSVDIDINEKISYRGSNKVMILINGEKTELTNSLSQIPAEQIEKIELINNPSAKYDAEGMSGIINIVLKSNDKRKKKTTMMLNAGYPETIGGHIGYSGFMKKSNFFINAGITHKTNFQTKEHLRENYENPTAYDYYQYDRQDKNLNNIFINSKYNYAFNKKQKLNIYFIGSKKMDIANRTINYKTLNFSDNIESEQYKEIDIDLNNYAINSGISYKHSLDNGSEIFSKINYALFSQMQEMNNVLYTTGILQNPYLQNTYSEQLNNIFQFDFNYSYLLNDSVKIETGYRFDAKDLLNDFKSESNSNTGEWINDTALSNTYNYLQYLQALYIDFSGNIKSIKTQIGLRAEYTIDYQNDIQNDDYIDIFPSISFSKKINKKATIYTNYNRRINRPTIKMLNPFSDEYADVLNMHKGNPALCPEYINSVELGSRFFLGKFSGFGAVYYRDIQQAISRIKSAVNDSALLVTFINLDKTKLLGIENSFAFDFFKKWRIILNSNLFYTNLTTNFGLNNIDNERIGWNLSIINTINLQKGIGIQIAGYYKSKLPSVMGIYQERYYIDFAISKKMLADKAILSFKITDLLNTYKYGLDLNAIDDNNYGYSQINRRKNESQYFILSFAYNLSSKKNATKKKEKFFLENFD